MTIVHAEEGALGPLFVLPLLRLHDIQDYRNSVFVVSSNKSLVGVCSVASHDAVSLDAYLCGLMVWHHNPRTRLERLLLRLVFLLAIDQHLRHIRCSEDSGLSPTCRVMFECHVLR